MLKFSGKRDKMNLDEFSKKYPDENSCIEAVMEKRLSMGLGCKKCGHTEHYFRKGDLKFECKNAMAVRAYGLVR